MKHNSNLLQFFCKRSSVKITSNDDIAIGTGFFINKNTIVTCKHVINNFDNNFKIHLNGMVEIVELDYVVSDIQKDLAFISTKNLFCLDFLTLSKTSLIKSNSLFYSYGYSKEFPNGDVITGKVLGNVEDENQFLKLTNSRVVSGFSGASVLGENGMIIGIISESFSQTSSLGGLAINSADIINSYNMHLLSTMGEPLPNASQALNELDYSKSSNSQDELEISKYLEGIKIVQNDKLLEPSVEDLYKKVITQCRWEKVPNLIINGYFNIGELNSDWINSFKIKAAEWQNPIKPKKLVLNHGEFIDKYAKTENKTGIQHIIDELRTKSDSNRACWSLYDMKTILNSGDKSIPSFMILQTGISKNGTTLRITAYYRALELSKFLPINIAESCIVADKINQALSYKFNSIRLVIHAFNAYVKDNFSCLEKAKIDLYDEATMMFEILNKKTAKKWIKSHLQEKIDTVESRIDLNGLVQLQKCINIFKSKSNLSDQDDYYDLEFVRSLDKSIKLVTEFNTIVSHSTYTTKAKDKYSELCNELNNSIINL